MRTLLIIVSVGIMLTGCVTTRTYARNDGGDNSSQAFMSAKTDCQSKSMTMAYIYRDQFMVDCMAGHGWEPQGY